jgi:hypothetical protein
MAYPSVTNIFQNNSLIDSVQCNQNFSDILSGVADGTKDVNIVNLTVAGSASVAGDVYTHSYSDYYSSSTVLGWATTGLSGNIYYKKVGKTVTVQYSITGTSTATTSSFTLPYNYNSAAILPNVRYLGSTYISSSLASTSRVGVVTLSNNNLVNCYKTYSGGVWSNVDTKSVQGTLIYEAV